MFISSGRPIEIVDAYRKKLRDVIESYIEKKLTGRISYRNKIEIHLELENGKIIACRGSDERGNIIEGNECIDLASRALETDEGAIEVQELTREQVSIDISESPQSHVDPDEAARKLIEHKKEKALEERTSKPLEEIARELPGFRIEAADPFEMIDIVTKAKLLYTKRYPEGAEGLKIIKEIIEQIQNRKIKAEIIYVKMSNNTTCRLAINLKKKVVSVECEEKIDRIAKEKLKHTIHQVAVFYIPRT
ncbi:MAG: hypothetical protein GXO32_04725 [Crenarchaeota archaeon]|nr:hypothetical protein [Thermoproteota archaeon]